MSEAKIKQITGLMRREKYRFSPARRVYIPKKNGRLRPLGMPTWTDKLVGEVVLLLEADYDPQFSDSSHGFRKSRGVPHRPVGNRQYLDRDHLGCLDHDILLGILAEKIHDNRFLQLVRHMLKAGYLEEWEYRDALSGVSQGSLCSAEHKPPYAQCRVMRSADA